MKAITQINKERLETMEGAEILSINWEGYITIKSGKAWQYCPERKKSIIVGLLTTNTAIGDVWNDYLDGEGCSQLWTEWREEVKSYSPETIEKLKNMQLD
jgi:hypothetical protein